MQRHLNDEYVRKSKIEGFRSRSSYKLLEINEKFNIFKKCNSVLDLGCAPGGWLQVAKQMTPEKSHIVGIDKNKIEEISGIDFVQNDIFDPKIVNILNNKFDSKIDILMSDMSPNSSGIKSVDHLRIVSLIERVVEIAKTILKPDGFFNFKNISRWSPGDLIKIIYKI